MSWAIWITGLPGSGKSVLARGVAAQLRARGERVTVLELDVIRKLLTPEPTYSDHERDVVYRALVYMARELTAAGEPVIVDATAHRREWRELARAAIPRFAEVQLTCPLDVCRERERARTTGNAPRQIYARAGQPGATVPGVDVPYEPALAPELVVDTATEPTAASVARIIAVAERLHAEEVPRPTAPEGRRMGAVDHRTARERQDDDRHGRRRHTRRAGDTRACAGPRGHRRRHGPR